MSKFFDRHLPDHVIFEANGVHCTAQGYMPRDLVRLFEDLDYRIYVVGAGRLAPRTAADFQEAALCDYLATRRSVDGLERFTVAEVPLGERVRQTVLATSLNPAYRLFMAKELDFAPAEVREHPEVVEATDILREDSVEKVRAVIEAWRR